MRFPLNEFPTKPNGVRCSNNPFHAVGSRVADSSAEEPLNGLALCRETLGNFPVAPNPVAAARLGELRHAAR
ncbi:hypothetical protein Enr13x_33940 [Stieleria neptunia]|uniref:Uncharacterized protein n=1 Tax=Stieleria neptunia TaxID=2527979 RepID=A0A518HRR8_9BACT|nr:hypothetical protein Enr13x_33940 [Stieleria neptunia]